MYPDGRAKQPFQNKISGLSENISPKDDMDGDGQNGERLQNSNWRTFQIGRNWITANLLDTDFQTNKLPLTTKC